jgi:hypothetical protein
MCDMMRAELQFGVRYLSSGMVVPTVNDKIAYHTVDKLLALGVPAEVKCRRITYGAWGRPQIKLLSRG